MARPKAAMIKVSGSKPSSPQPLLALTPIDQMGRILRGVPGASRNA
jgi:hypothetical protein